MQRAERAADRLAACLAEAVDAARAADAARLAGLVAATEAALAALSADPPDRGALAHLRAEAARTAALLEAAAAGTRAARLRLCEVRRLAAGAATYDASGRRAQLAGHGADRPARR